MKNLFVTFIALGVTSAFAIETNLSGNVAKSLYYSLLAQKEAGSKIEVNSNSVRGGFQTSLWVKNGNAQCTKSESNKNKTVVFTCSVIE